MNLLVRGFLCALLVYSSTLAHADNPGDSADGPWTLSYQQMADDTAAVIEQLGLGPVDIVGHSDGANIGLLVARDHPALVRRLVVSGANLRSGWSAEEVRQRSQWPAAQLAAKLQTISDGFPP